jgi:hypothetical protein
MDASFVPPEGFASKRWYKPERRGSRWFYHRPEPLRPPAFLRDYTTVDPQMRLLVAKLHSHGVPTMPSCSGHWQDRTWARTIFRDLLQDVEAIRTTGMVFVDVESGQRVRYKDLYYVIPWTGAEEFLAALGAAYGCGYLAFVPPPASLIWSRVADVDAIPGVRAMVSGLNRKLGIEIRVRTGDTASQAEAWRLVLKALRLG